MCLALVSCGEYHKLQLARFLIVGGTHLDFQIVIHVALWDVNLRAEVEVAWLAPFDVLFDEGQVIEVVVEIELVIVVLKVEDVTHGLVHHDELAVGMVE